jgi:flagellar basal body-associated protein FliL
MADPVKPPKRAGNILAVVIVIAIFVAIIGGLLWFNSTSETSDEGRHVTPPQTDQSAPASGQTH